MGPLTETPHVKWLTVFALVLAGCGSAAATVNASDAPLLGPLTASVTAVRVTTTSTPPATSPLGYRVLPIAVLTPGITDTRVTPDTITTTICVSGWSPRSGRERATGRPIFA
jgi:hypothetical protein